MKNATHATQSADVGRSTDASAGRAERMAVAFGLSTAITVLFNTVLAWIKEAAEPVHDFMAVLTGHHWWTHGILDLIVFFVLGWVLMSRGTQEHLTGNLVVKLAAAVIVAGAGIAGWFLFI